MVNNNSGNKNLKCYVLQINVYFLNTNTGLYVFFIDLFYH